MDGGFGGGGGGGSGGRRRGRRFRRRRRRREYVPPRGSRRFRGRRGSGFGGGGGLGAGGDIFVQQGASLTITGGTLASGTVTGGAGATSSQAGRGLGDGLFIQGNQSVILSPASGQTLTIAGHIVDQTGAGGTGANQAYGTLVINGAGTVDLLADNTPTLTASPAVAGFGGSILLDSGVLDLAVPTAGGTGTIALAGTAELVTGSIDTTLAFNGGFVDDTGLAYVQGETAYAAGGTLTIGTASTTVATLAVAASTTGYEAVTYDDAGGTYIIAASALSAVVAPYLTQTVTSSAQLEAAIDNVERFATALASVGSHAAFAIDLAQNITLAQQLSRSISIAAPPTSPSTATGTR